MSQDILYQRSQQLATYSPDMPWDSILAELANDADWWRQNIIDVILAEGIEAANTRAEAYKELKRPAVQSDEGYYSSDWERPKQWHKGDGKGRGGGKGNSKGKGCGKGGNAKGSGKGKAEKGGKGQEKNPDGTYRLSRTGVQICRAWGKGGCEATCPHGRIHCCEICRGNHRTIHHKDAASGTVSDM